MMTHARRRCFLWLAHSILPSTSFSLQPCTVPRLSEAPFHSAVSLGAAAETATLSTRSSDEFTKSYHLHGTGTRSRVSLKTDTGHVLQTDVPKKMGGSDAAPQPVETLLAALIGCTQATAVFVGRNMQQQQQQQQQSRRLWIDSLEFDVRAHRDERGAIELPILEGQTPLIPSRLHTVEGTITVHLKKGTAPITESELKVLSEQTEARCPVANMMIASGCEMKIQWKAGSLPSQSLIATN